MPVISHMDPLPSLEGASYRPAPHIVAPLTNTVESTVYHGPEKITAPNENPEHTDWLRRARNAYESSETWLQVNQRMIWSRNIAHYRSEHAPDSPILNSANRNRSKHFYPKTRTLVRDIQAAAAEAHFSNADVVAIEAEDQDNPMQVAAASFMKALVNYRLQNTIPWYLLILGGHQEAAVMGTVCSHQSWEYQEEEYDHKIEFEAETGFTVETYKVRAVVDRPVVRLIPAENIRISPAADWLDPANSSPYLIELMPMYLGDIKAKIAQGADPKTGEPAWRDIGENFLISAGNRDNLDATRRARAGKSRMDPKSNQTEIVNDFRIVWIHRNIVRHNNKDWLYYTAGTHAMLSDPVPLQDVIPWAKGKRDYTLGKMEVETDRAYPAGPVEIVSGMQKAFNELKNQRFDNVRQVLNRRYLYRAGQQVDVRALMDNRPGGLVGVSAPGPLDNHVSPLPVQDVTSSSFQEEDRLALAMDDLTGSSTVSTVNSNRRLHETATGMSLMAETGNRIRSMELRTINETWVEPTLKQIVQLEAYYETDEVAMTVAAKQAGILQILPEFFDVNFSVSVNVGMNSTSPTQRMNRITSAVTTVMQAIPDAVLAVNGDEVAKEVFSAAGFDNGSRFFNFAKAEAAKQNAQADPQIQLQMQQIQQRAESEQAKVAIQQAKLQLEAQKLELDSLKTQKQLEELDAKINLIIAQTAVQNTTAVFEATQAAGTVASNPAMAPVTDEILASAGFKDHNKAPIVLAPEQPQEVVPPVDQNTHPNFPPKPQAADVGARAGMTTPGIE